MNGQAKLQEGEVVALKALERRTSAPSPLSQGNICFPPSIDQDLVRDGLGQKFKTTPTRLRYTRRPLLLHATHAPYPSLSLPAAPPLASTPHYSGDGPLHGFGGRCGPCGHQT